jgi:hypothetical protein
LMRVNWLSKGGGPGCSDTPSSPVTSSSFSTARACITDSTAQHSTAQHSTAQHSTAQHSTAQHRPYCLRQAQYQVHPFKMDSTLKKGRAACMFVQQLCAHDLGHTACAPRNHKPSCAALHCAMPGGAIFMPCCAVLCTWRDVYSAASPACAGACTASVAPAAAHTGAAGSRGGCQTLTVAY